VGVRGEFFNEIVQLLLGHLLQLFLVILAVVEEVRELVTLGLFDGDLFDLVVRATASSPSISSVAWEIPLTDPLVATAARETLAAAIGMRRNVPPLMSARAAFLASHSPRLSTNSAFI